MLFYIYEVKTAEHIDSEVLFPKVHDQMTKKFKLHVNFSSFQACCSIIFLSARSEMASPIKTKQTKLYSEMAFPIKVKVSQEWKTLFS